MKELKCPVCGKQMKLGTLDQDDSMGTVWMSIMPCDCVCSYGASKAVWQELIRTRKELDIRKKQVEIANKAFDFINTEWDNVDCSRKELGACAFNAKEDIAGWESDIETALEQITALEQKDVK